MGKQLLKTKKDTFRIFPVGYVRRKNEGIYLEIINEYIPAMLQLEHFSHVHIFWWFSEYQDNMYRKVTQSEPPYEAPLTGVFASRSPVRPNPIGLSVVKILDVNNDNGIIEIADIDAYHPQIRIIEPRRGMLYFRDNSIFELKYERTMVIDDIVFRLDVKPGDAPIEKVDFYYDDNLIFTDKDPPYQWKLNKISVRKRNVRAVLYDEKGRTAEDEITFRFINFLRII